MKWLRIELPREIMNALLRNTDRVGSEAIANVKIFEIELVHAPLSTSFFFCHAELIGRDAVEPSRINDMRG
jgi:hypothetical protein